MKALDFNHVKTCTIRNKRFRLMWRKPPLRPHPDPTMEWKGACHQPSGSLWIYPKQTAEELLSTTIHEVTHGAFWDIEDDAVIEFERDLMRLLKRMGLQVSFKL